MSTSIAVLLVLSAKNMWIWNTLQIKTFGNSWIVHEKVCVKETCEISHICKTKKYCENFYSILYKLCQEYALRGVLRFMSVI